MTKLVFLFACLASVGFLSSSSAELAQPRATLEPACDSTSASAASASADDDAEALTCGLPCIRAGGFCCGARCC